MSPYQHGQVFVTKTAPRPISTSAITTSIDEFVQRESNVTTGGIYNSVITKGTLSRGDYLGGTVQVMTNEIKSRVQRLAQVTNTDALITEVGGTVGDIESLPFLEAIRQFRKDIGRENVLYIHVTLVPVIGVVGELKTKATQHSVAELLARDRHSAGHHRGAFGRARTSARRSPSSAMSAPTRRRLGERCRRHSSHTIAHASRAPRQPRGAHARPRVRRAHFFGEWRARHRPPLRQAGDHCPGGEMLAPRG